MLKRSPEDFRVTERLAADYIVPKGRFSVYRVSKRKLTSLEAAAGLAELAGTNAGDVGMAGLKDRQGVTVQYMSVEGGQLAYLRTPELKIEHVGFATEKLESRHSEGNSFDIRLRGLHGRELERLKDEARVLQDVGVPNYFDEQRFGNLRHGEGWIFLDVLAGRLDSALRRLVLGGLPRRDERQQRFAAALERQWGDWRACRELAGKLGRHHSVFEHLARTHDDFVGAFERFSTRVKLIHLYAFQSHLWNRAVARYVEANWDAHDRVVVSGIEGPLVFPTAQFRGEARPETFRLPGPGFTDVEDPEQLRLLTAELRAYGLDPPRFEVKGVSGFAIKGEDRPLWVSPQIAPLRPEMTAEGGERAALSVRLRFDLPRGAYATIVVKRLLSRVPRLQRDFEVREAVAPRTSGGPRDYRGSSERSHARKNSPWGDPGRSDDRRSDRGGYGPRRPGGDRPNPGRRERRELREGGPPGRGGSGPKDTRRGQGERPARGPWKDETR